MFSLETYIYNVDLFVDLFSKSFHEDLNARNIICKTKYSLDV